MSPNSKKVEILSIGTELLLGNIVNTNTQWISEQLSQLGLLEVEVLKGQESFRIKSFSANNCR